jgi:hypothetical protein
MKTADLVLATLRDPESALALPPAGWDLLIRQARRADLLARIALLLDRAGLTDRVAPGPRQHLMAARTLAAAQHLEIRREVAWIERALQPLGLQPVLLKGAAYLIADAPAALGRTFDDVDLMVPKPRLPEVESHLMMGGWVTTHLSAYDQRYYREWMHELPPMQHAVRHSVLDVHHAILPETAHVRPRSDLLLADAVVVRQAPSWRVLAPVDMLLHSMTHLFHNEELGHGLRDLSDQDLMMRTWGLDPQDPGFWDRLQARALQLHLQRSLHYGLQQAHALLGTPIPLEARAAAAQHAAAAPVDGLMSRLWRAGLHTPHSSAREALTPWADFALFVRAHALRMPPGMLLRHLAVKAWRRHVVREEGA